MVQTFDGESEQAVTKFREALGGLRQLGDVFDTGLVSLSMLRALGADHAEARAAAEQAIPALERLGARPLLAQLRAELGIEHEVAAGPRSESSAAVPAAP